MRSYAADVLVSARATIGRRSCRKVSLPLYGDLVSRFTFQLRLCGLSAASSQLKIIFYSRVDYLPRTRLKCASKARRSRFDRDEGLIRRVLDEGEERAGSLYSFLFFLPSLFLFLSLFSPLFFFHRVLSLGSTRLPADQILTSPAL